MSAGYAPLDGIDVYHEQHGDGPPLVLLHGGALTIDLCFGRLLPRLADRHRVIAVELQGHGHTADVDREPSLAAMAADVTGVLDHLDVAVASLFGFSLGGLVATELAVRRPERVDRLVLAGSHVRADGYRPEVTAGPDFDPASPLLPTDDDFAAMRAAYEAVAPDPGHFEDFLARLQPVVADFTGWTDAELARITAPTLVVVGDRDFVRVEHAELMCDTIPDARLVVVDDATHMALLSREPAADAIVEFLAEDAPA